jgi:peptidoglycan/LPS O-acetylase OafA/YrhL
VVQLLVFVLLLVPLSYWCGARYDGLVVGVAWDVSSLFALVRVFLPFSIGVLIDLLKNEGWRDSNAIAIACILLLVVALVAPIQNGAIYDTTCVCVIFPALLYISSSVKVNGGVAKTMKWLGAISYPLYAINQPFFRICGAAFGGNGEYNSVFPVAVFLALVVLTELCRLVWEEPVRRFLKAKFFASNRFKSGGLESKLQHPTSL